MSVFFKGETSPFWMFILNASCASITRDVLQNRFLFLHCIALLVMPYSLVCFADKWWHNPFALDCSVCSSTTPVWMMICWLCLLLRVDWWQHRMFIRLLPQVQVWLYWTLHEGLKGFSEYAQCHVVLNFSPTNGHLGGVCQEFHVLTVALLVEVLQNQLIQM